MAISKGCVRYTKVPWTTIWENGYTWHCGHVRIYIWAQHGNASACSVLWAGPNSSFGIKYTEVVREWVQPKHVLKSWYYWPHCKPKPNWSIVWIIINTRVFSTKKKAKKKQTLRIILERTRGDEQPWKEKCCCLQAKSKDYREDRGIKYSSDYEQYTTLQSESMTNRVSLFKQVCLS